MPTWGCAYAWHLCLRPEILRQSHNEGRTSPLAVIAGEDPRSPKRQGHYYTYLFFSTISDSKRQQTTAVDYKRLFNGLVLTRALSLWLN